MRLYQYVGPKDVAAQVDSSQRGWRVRTVADLVAWLQKPNQEWTRDGQLVVTFVVDDQSELRIADRRSEHVVCAGSGEVFAAGEMTFELVRGAVRVVEVSNQSTGYCPDLESWSAVEMVLQKVGLTAPNAFTTSCLFRKCASCLERNLVKDGAFVCDLCGKDLPLEYNF